jgi:hypothetical protein
MNAVLRHREERGDEAIQNQTGLPRPFGARNDDEAV